jgi:TonB family protein
MMLRRPIGPCGAVILALVVVIGAAAQNPGEEVPALHPARSAIARPVYTGEHMVVGSWQTVAVGSGERTLSGEPLPYEILVTESEVSVSSARDPYGPRVFGIVGSRRVGSAVEYELRGQGGRYLLTAQLGLRPGAGPTGPFDAVFVLTRPGSSARSERFAPPGAPPPDAVARGTASGPVAEPTPRAEGRRRRVSEDARSEPVSVANQRVRMSDLLGAVVRRVTPTYPDAARAANVQGTVVVEVSIDESGKVDEARAVSGPAPLRGEAERAARGWRFRPFLVDGAPSQVTGTLTFRFAN